jgi:hypothetical protein
VYTRFRSRARPRSIIARSFIEGDRDGHLPEVQAQDSQERQPHQARVRLVSQDLPRQAGPRRQVTRPAPPRRTGRRIAPAPRRCVRMVEGKGFVRPEPPSSSDLSTPSLPQAAPSGIPRPPASTVPDPTPSPDGPPSAAAPQSAEPREQKQEEGAPRPDSNGRPGPADGLEET